MNMLLQATEAIQGIPKLIPYSEMDIVKGMIVCVVLMAMFGAAALWVYSKYGRQKLEITDIQAVQISGEVLKQVGDLNVEGVKASKMFADARHDIKTIKNSKDDQSSIAFESLEELKAMKDLMDNHYKSFTDRDVARIKEQADKDTLHHKEMADREEKYHKERMQLLEKHHQESLKLVKERNLKHTA